MARISYHDRSLSDQGGDMRTVDFAALIGAMSVGFFSTTLVGWRSPDFHTVLNLGGSGLTPKVEGGVLVNIPTGIIAGFDYHDDTIEIVYSDVAIKARDFMAFVNAQDWTGLAEVLRQGDDIISGSQNRDILLGGDGNDYVTAASYGNDRLSGGAGQDTIRASEGRDVLSGGADADAFWFYGYSFGHRDVDSITDFSHGEDVIWLSASAFGLLGPQGSLMPEDFARGGQAMTTEPVLVYRQSTGALFLDENGSDAAGRALLTQFEPGTILNAHDFLLV